MSSTMVCNGVLIYPSEGILSYDIHLRPAEEFVHTVSEKRDILFRSMEVTGNGEDYILALHYPEMRSKHPTVVGDTVLVFHEGEGVHYKMTFLDFGAEECKPTNAYNVMGSVLHNKGHKVWGAVIITKTIRGGDDAPSLVSCTVEEVIRLLYRRAWHTGLFYANGGAGAVHVEMDNAWNIRQAGGDMLSLRCRTKRRVEGDKVRVDTPDGYYIFLLLDEESPILVDAQDPV